MRPTEQRVPHTSLCLPQPTLPVQTGIQMSPIKIVKNPDGSMQRAAMTQARAALWCRPRAARLLLLLQLWCPPAARRRLPPLPAC